MWWEICITNGLAYNSKVNKNMCHCNVFALFYFIFEVFEGNF